MTEKSTQSTAGNNLLSQTEYDALLSHISAYQWCVFAEKKDLIDMWRFASAGDPLDKGKINMALVKMSSLPRVSGRGAEADRILNALCGLFGITLD